MLVALGGNRGPETTQATPGRPTDWVLRGCWHLIQKAKSSSTPDRGGTGLVQMWLSEALAGLRVRKASCTLIYAVGFSY